MTPVTLAQPRTAPLAGDPARGDGGLPEHEGEGGADGREIRIYEYVTRRGEISSIAETAAHLGLSVSEVAVSVARLAGLHLLRTSGERLVPITAEAAAASLISPLERDIYQRRDLADQFSDRSAIDAFDDVAAIRGLLKLAAEVCRREVVVLRPGLDDGDLLDDLLEPCYSVLDRDVTVRVVCPHRYRAGFATRSAVRRLVDSGAQIRTLSQVPHAAVVFDRTIAVTLSLSRPGGGLTGRRVRDPDVAQFLVGLFDQLWDAATPFAVAEPGYADAVDDLQQSIARLMAQGLTDEVVARRLGMSVRTCRRHIAVLLANLGSISRFQAGVQAATRFSLPG
jgi:DNA-binding CsgD family transcriptional regulator/DNA-binding Lrp family transcriptional regulator